MKMQGVSLIFDKNTRGSVDIRWKCKEFHWDPLKMQGVSLEFDENAMDFTGIR